MPSALSGFFSWSSNVLENNPKKCYFVGACLLVIGVAAALVATAATGGIAGLGIAAGVVGTITSTGLVSAGTTAGFLGGGISALHVAATTAAVAGATGLELLGVRKRITNFFRKIFGFETAEAATQQTSGSGNAPAPATASITTPTPSITQVAAAGDTPSTSPTAPRSRLQRAKERAEQRRGL